jgi:hypothetical protein
MVARFSIGVFAKEILMETLARARSNCSAGHLEPTHFRPKARASNSSDAGRCSAKYDQS